MALLCGGGMGVLFLLGSMGPEISVYTGNEVPQGFVETLKEVGALSEEETLLYFYSDALYDIRDGCYLVSDRKVAVYRKAAATPLVTVPYENIANAEMYRNESFFFDSETWDTSKSFSLM